VIGPFAVSKTTTTGAGELAACDSEATTATASERHITSSSAT
jgi:hypothetical protein